MMDFWQGTEAIPHSAPCFFKVNDHDMKIISSEKAP